MKEMLNEIKKGFFKKKYFTIRLVMVIGALILMGFSLSWLILVDMGMDPCTLMNIAIADALGWSLGNWQAFLNLSLFIVVLICGAKNIGFGTIANIFLVGYSVDFFSWIWSRVLPEGLFDSLGVRILVLIPALIIFVLAVGVYIDMDMGTSPYDALPSIISNWLPKIPYRIVRIIYDAIVMVIGMLFGGIPGVVTVVMVFAIGPVITWVGNKIKAKWDFAEKQAYDSTAEYDKMMV